MQQEIFNALLGGGGGLAIVAALLFFLYRSAQLRAESITDRYIAHLESEALEDVTESPTRPVRPRAAKVN